MAYVTGEAAAHVDATGRFVLRTPTPIGPDTEITANQARALADIVVHRYKRATLPFYEQQRGAPIDRDALRPCGRVTYAASPSAPLPRTVDVVTRRALGSWWLASFCGESGEPVLSEAVAAQATDLEIQGNRIVRRETAGGVFFTRGEFLTMGIPRGHEIPMAPEIAVQHVAEATRRRVSKVPELVIPGAFIMPHPLRSVLALVLAGEFYRETVKNCPPDGHLTWQGEELTLADLMPRPHGRTRTQCGANCCRPAASLGEATYQGAHYAGTTPHAIENSRERCAILRDVSPVRRPAHPSRHPSLAPCP